MATMETKQIAVLVGSLRKESYNRKMAVALAELAPATLRLGIIEINRLPMYNEELDENPPEPWVTFREQVKRSDGVLFVTPEYNRSIPAVLKNAIDVGSRPYGKNVWDGKPGAVVSVSPGATGGFGANHHLRQSLVFLNIPVMQQPEAYIGGAARLFDETGELIHPTVRELMTRFIHSYAKWVEAISPGRRSGVVLPQVSLAG